MAVITGVGAACVDFLNTIEEYPAEDHSTHITGTVKRGGGACATAVVAAVKLGMRGCFIGNVGAGEIGEDIILDLADNRVSVKGMKRVEGHSPVSQIMISPDGQRTKFVQNNTLAPIEWTEEKKDTIRNSDILHLDGTRIDNALAAAEIAKEAGILISLDGCHMEKDKALNRQLACMSDILIMNTRFPTMVSGMENVEDALKYFASHGPKVVATTLGTKGTLAVINGKIESFPAYKVDTVDSTSAGDVYHGAFLAAYLRGYDVVQCIKYASAAAAIKCTRTGGRIGIPDHRTVLRFLAERGETFPEKA